MLVRSLEQSRLHSDLRAVALVSVALLALACDEAREVIDSGLVVRTRPGADTGVWLDAGFADATPRLDATPRDTGTTTDAGTTGDSGVIADGGPITDGATGDGGAADAGPLTDGGGTVDAGPVTDSGDAVDAGPVTDSGGTVDAGPIADSGGTVDAGPIPDSGGTVDAGPVTDSGGTVDAGPIPDGGGSVDAGPIADGGGTVDAGPIPDSGGTVDAGPVTDSGGETDAGSIPDAGQGAADAGLVDTGVVADAGSTATGAVVITEIMAVTSDLEWFEVLNTGTQSVDLTDYTVVIDSHPGLGAQPIFEAGDPDGNNGVPLILAAGARMWGAANPTDPARIPATADFVFGDPNAYGPNAFDDGGDRLALHTTQMVDEVDFNTTVTATGADVPAGAFVLVAESSLELDDALGTLGLESANDSGDAWCAVVFGAPTPGSANHDCARFVISEVLYDYDSLTSALDDGREFLEIAGPAGGPLTDVQIAVIQGASASAGSVLRTISLGSGRMPSDGLFVVADALSGGGTEVAGADLVTGLNMQNGPDALQLLRVPPGAGASLLDAFGYGTLPAGLVDDNHSLPVFEGTTVLDPAPDVHSVDWARRDDEADTGDNAADFFFDPSPTPGARNGASLLTLASIEPSNAVVTDTATVVLRGDDLTDDLRVTLGAQLVPVASCGFAEPNTFVCEVEHPSPSSAIAETVTVTIVSSTAHAQTASLADSFTWTVTLNETDVANEVDYCVLQHPATATAAASMPTQLIFGQLYEQGMTDVTSGAHPSIRAQLGYGPTTAAPTTSNAWHWVDAVFNVEVGNNDEYMATLTIDAPGTYAYTLRFSLDGGLTWTYADTDGAGSNGGLDFETANLGVLTVVP